MPELLPGMQIIYNSYMLPKPLVIYTSGSWRGWICTTDSAGKNWVSLCNINDFLPSESKVEEHKR